MSQGKLLSKRLSGATSLLAQGVVVSSVPHRVFIPLRSMCGPSSFLLPIDLFSTRDSLVSENTAILIPKEHHLLFNL